MRRYYGPPPFWIPSLNPSLNADQLPGTVFADGAASFAAASSQYLSVASNPSLNCGTKMTLEATVLNVDHTAPHTIATKWDNQTDGSWAAEIGGDGKLYCYIAANAGDAPATNSATSSVVVSDNTFTDIAVVYDGTQTGNANRLKFYFNGVQDNSIAFTGTIPATLLANSAAVRLGKWGGNLTRYFNGRMGPVRIWNVALTQANITALYNGGVGLFHAGLPTALLTGLAASYDCTEHTGQRLDKSGNGNHLAPSAGVSQVAGVTGASKAAQFTAAAATQLSIASNAALNPGAKATWEFWMNRAATGVIHTPLSKFTTGNTDNSYLFRISSDKLNVYVAASPSDGGSNSGTSSVTIPAAWTHVVVVYDGTQTGNANRLKMYFNGVQDTSLVFNGTIAAALLANALAMVVGGWSTANQYFDGPMDVLRLWNVPLSQANVTTLYNSGVPLPYASLGALTTGLVADYEFEDATNLGYDSAGANHLTDITPAAVGFASGIVEAQGNDGDPIGITTDAVGSAKLTLTQATLANRPFLKANAINGKPVLQFGGAHWMASASVLGSRLFSTTECYVAAVMRQPLAGVSNSILGWGSATGIHAPYSDNNIYFDFGNQSQGRLLVAKPAGWNTGFHLLECWRQSDGTQVIAVDGVTLTSGVLSATVVVANPATLSIGTYSNNFANCDLALLVISPTYPGDGKRAQFKRYIAQTYGLAIS